VTTPTPDQSGEAADVPQDGPVTTEPGAEVVPARIVHEARPKEVPLTRRPMARWDRVKFLLLIFLLFWFFVWAEYADANPFNTFGDALRDTLETKWFLELLFVAEALRQVHYLISEHSKRYHRFWTKSVFGRVERRTGRMNDYTRYRMSRALKVVLGIVIISIIAGTIYDVPPATALVELPSRVWGFLPIVLQLVLFMFFAVGQIFAIFYFMSRGGVDTYMPEEVERRFSDVWGQDHVLDRVKENVVLMEKPDVIEAKGGQVPSGLLLYGPPGTGKSLMAEAVAGETGKPFVSVDPGAFINMFMGVGILKVMALFRKLRKLALRYGGVIVFFDEADSLGSRGGAVPGPAQIASPWADGVTDHLRWLSPEARAVVLSAANTDVIAGTSPGRTRDGIIMGGMGGGGMGTLQALLSQLSGLKKPRGIINRYGRRMLGMKPKPPPRYRILIMMATNMPEALDPALLRPGRIDRMYKVGYPSKDGRKRTFDGYLDKVSHELTDEDVEKLATITPYATGASIQDMVNEALINAIREGREVVTWGDMMAAKHLKELGPPEDVEYIERERHAIAVHEACHAVAAYKSRGHMTIDLATIEKGGNYLGMVSSVKPEDQFTTWRSEFESDIMVSLASLAGERMFFGGDNSSGVMSDLEKATSLAIMMEGYWGMGQTIASHGVSRRLGIGGGGGGAPKPTDEDDQRDLLKGNLGERIEDNLARLLGDTEVLLAEHRAQVLRLAHALETHKTIAGDDVIAVIEGRQGPLIDGSVYADDGFVEAMEAFHASVVFAHTAHDKVAVPLPRANGQHPDDEPVAAVTPAGNGATVPAGAPVEEQPQPQPRPAPGGNGAG
jgi:ATP-dependent Zn protease